MTGYIYTLSYIDTNEVFYVGSTFTPTNRRSSHRTNKGYNVELDIIEQVEVKQRWDLQKIESYWIEQLKQWGFNLTNKIIHKYYLGAPADIIDYILEIQNQRFPMSEMNMNFFKEIIWSLIREHKECKI